MDHYKKKSFEKKTLFKNQIKNKIIKKITRKEKKIFVRYFDDKIKSNNTFDLLNYIKKKHKKIKLYFLIGADNLVKFHKWYNWKKIPKLAKIVVFARENYSIRSINYLASKSLKKKDWLYINSKKVNISSSLIRKFW